MFGRFIFSSSKIFGSFFKGRLCVLSMHLFSSCKILRKFQSFSTEFSIWRFDLIFIFRQIINSSLLNFWHVFSSRFKVHGKSIFFRVVIFRCVSVPRGSVFCHVSVLFGSHSFFGTLSFYIRTLSSVFAIFTFSSSKVFCTYIFFLGSQFSTQLYSKVLTFRNKHIVCGSQLSTRLCSKVFFFPDFRHCYILLGFHIFFRPL